jgi:hypothetical protein
MKRNVFVFPPGMMRKLVFCGNWNRVGGCWYE